MAVSLGAALAELRATEDSLDRLVVLLSSLRLYSPEVVAKRTSIPLAKSWRWRFEVNDALSAAANNPQHVITDIRDWFDLTCTDRSEFDGLEQRLQNARTGAWIRIKVAREGRHVRIQDCDTGMEPDVEIECN